MNGLSNKVDAEIIKENIIVKYAKTINACSAIVKKVKGILIAFNESDAEDPSVGLKSSDWAWKLAHEITHLNNYEDTMYRPDEGAQIIKEKEELTDLLAIRRYLNEDELLNCYIENCGNVEETAEDLEVPVNVLQKAFLLFSETSEHFRKRCVEIHTRYLWAQD